MPTPSIPTLPVPAQPRALPATLLPSAGGSAPREKPSSTLAFVLFILVNAVLLIRPAEIFPEMAGIEIYFYAIAACSLFATMDVLRSVCRPIDTQPIMLCIFGLFVAVLVPHLITLNFEEAWKTGFHFFKNVVYFLLFVSLINTPGRLQVFGRCLLLIAGFVVVIAILEYHQVITLSTMNTVEDSDVGSWGEVTFFERLRFTGILNDPNEVCVWLATLLPLTLYYVFQDRDLFRRALWLGVLVLYAYGIYLTRSRGGFLAMLAGLGVAVGFRYGRQRAALVAAIGLPILLLLFAGRQTNLDATSGTGQTRVQIWSDWLDRFRENPLVGEGMNFKDLDSEQWKALRALGVGYGHVAHNSFLQAFADVGFAGGCLFLGAFYVAVWSVGRRGAFPPVRFDPSMRDLQPFLLGAIVAYCVGMMTLSLWIVAPTYIVLGLAASYGRVYPALPAVRFDTNLLTRFALAGVVFLAAMYLFVRMFVNWG